MNILLICKRFYTNKDLIDERFGRNFEIPRLLAKSGHQVTVVAIDYRGKQFSVHKLFGVTFYSLPIFSFRFFSGVSVLRKELGKRLIDVVIGSGDSHIGYLTCKLGAFWQAKFVFDVYDQYESFASNRLPLMKTMYYQSLRKADLVVCASRRLQEFASEYNYNVVTIENGVDIDRFKQIDKSLCRRSLNISVEQTVIGYFGSMEPMRGLSYLVDACKFLRATFPDLRLLIAGRRHPDVVFDAPWIDYRGQVSHDEVVTLINACDVVTIPYVPDSLVDYGNSCKTGEYLACHIPLVATSVDNFVNNYPEVASAMPQAVCEPANANELARALNYQLVHRQLVDFPVRVTWMNLAKVLERHLLSLTGGFGRGKKQ